MVDRIWDVNNQYAHGFLKEYSHWVWEVSYRQHTLGSFIIFSKRPVERFSELRTQEMGSLVGIMKEIEKTLSEIKIFRPDRFNYWQMGNSLHHLHIHGIPRYKEPRWFDNRKWVDKSWGDIPIWEKQDASDELVRKIRDIIKPYLKK